MVTLRQYLSAGQYHAVAVKEDGTVVGMGYNNNDDSLNVSSWTDITAVACGAQHTLGLKSDGTVVATGLNTSGQCNVSGWTDVVYLAAGNNHSLGIKSNGAIVVAGTNEEGETGATVQGWENIETLCCGFYASLGLQNNGVPLYEGNNTYSQATSTGWSGIKYLDIGDYWIVGVYDDGTVTSVGITGTHRSVTGWTDIKQVACGWTVNRHTVGLKNDGTCVAVGSDADGQLAVTAWEDIAIVEATGYWSIGVKTDGTVVITGSQNAPVDWTHGITDWTGLKVQAAPDPEPEPEPEPGDPEITQAGQYTLTITGAPPALIPCANFLARLRSARRSYLQATVPYTQAMADLISARPNEDLELRFYDSAGDPHIVLTVKLDGIQIIKGVQSSSIVLTGWRQSTNATPATHADIQAMTVASGSNSSTMLMPGYRPDIKPADTVQAEGVSFIAGLVTVQGAARKNDIEVRTTMSEEATV